MVSGGPNWERLLRDARRLLNMRNRMSSASKFAASGAGQHGGDIDAVRRYWRKEIGVDNFIERECSTWSGDTSPDASRCAEPPSCRVADMATSPFIFERLVGNRGDSRGTQDTLAGIEARGLPLQHQPWADHNAPAQREPRQ